MEFFNDKRAGRVTVNRILTESEEKEKQTARHQSQLRDHERQIHEQRAAEYYTGLLENPTGTIELRQKIERRLEQDNVDARVEKSRSVVGSLSFYVEAKDGRLIKVSDHNTAAQAMGHDNIGFVNLKDGVSDDDVYERVKKMLTEYNAALIEDEDGNWVQGSARRYQSRNTAAVELEEENAALREDVEKWKKLAKLADRITNGKILDPTSVRPAATWLMEQTGAKGDRRGLAEELKSFYSKVLEMKNPTWEDMQSFVARALEYHASIFADNTTAEEMGVERKVKRC